MNVKFKLLKKYYLFFFFTLSLKYIFSQESINIEYGNKIDESVTLGSGFSYKTNSLGFKVDNVKFNLKPNENLSLDFIFRYRWLSFNFSITPKFFNINDDNDQKGISKNFNLGTNIYITPKLRQSINYNTLEGFYLSNTNEFLSNFKNVYIQFPNLKFTSYSGETIYLWKGDKHSYYSFNDTSYRPENNEFVLISGLYYRYSLIEDNGSVLIPDADYNDFLEDKYRFQEIRFDLRTGAGIQRKINNNWFFILELYPQLNLTTYPSEKLYELNYGLKGMSRFGFDNQSWFISTLNSINYVKNSNENFYSTSQWYFSIAAGFRFKAPKILKKTFDKIDSKLGL